MKINAILLRAPEASSSPDKYLSAFESIGLQCRAVCIPVLETVIVNLDKLQEVITREQPNVDGAIMTSARSCEAWKTSVAQPDRSITEAWSRIPFYVVGSATAASLREIYPEPGQIRGEHTGTAEQLARFILDDLQDDAKRLLYLTGDKNRDTLPSIMSEGHVELESLQVYGTCGSSRFPADLGEALNGLDRDAEFWIIFFAPSAAEFVYPHLQACFRFQSATDSLSIQSGSDQLLPLARIAAIGPTTASFLHDTLHLHVDVVAPKPNPHSLVEAIRAHFEGLRNIDDT
ncbi:hypothetical protein GYMLUDRAFT_235777 [Collybiopsis luxurians FD-317 M1]|nr:hypothetical protein GYMLUDRAFT_235777 [Collybiopsis luxurians FD-317 M1]